jgi:hypothetical protein
MSGRGGMWRLLRSPPPPCLALQYALPVARAFLVLTRALPYLPPVQFPRATCRCSPGGPVEEAVDGAAGHSRIGLVSNLRLKKGGAGG